MAAGRPLAVHQPEKLDSSALSALSELRPDVSLVVAYGHILREEFIALPRLGTLNLHASLLPRYRGASPIQTAVASGDRETGMTLMRIVRELDDEHDVIPLAIDTDRSVAAIAVAAWAEQTSGRKPGLWKVSLTGSPGRWTSLSSGGGGPLLNYPLEHRRPVGGHGLHVRLCLGPDPEPGSPSEIKNEWISSILQVTAEVDRVQVGARTIEVPFHGYVAVAIRAAERVITAIDSSGSPLQSMDLNRRDLFRVQSPILRDVAQSPSKS